MHIIVHRAVGFHDGPNHIVFPITNVLQEVPAWLACLHVFKNAINLGVIEEVKLPISGSTLGDESHENVAQDPNISKPHRGRPRKEETEQK